MDIALTIFAILAILLFIQSAASLQSGFRFLHLVQDALAKAPGHFTPHTAVIAAIKGSDEGLERNLRSVLCQDYPCYDVIFVTADDADDAAPVLQALAASKAIRNSNPGLKKVSVTTAGHCQKRGEKVHNLRRGLELAAEDCEVLVFADADANPYPDWLRWMVAPLEDSSVTVNTGFRWYLPSEGFASGLRAAWDTSIATLLGEHHNNFAWGGSMAIRKVDFDRLEICDKHWASTVSDDYAVRTAVRNSKGRIRFEPRCLVRSGEEISFKGFIRWANRQIILTRVYAPDLWWPGFAAHALYGATFIAGIVALLAPAASGEVRLGIAGSFCLILILGMAKGGIRSAVARRLYPEDVRTLGLRGSSYWLLSPLVPWVMLWNLLVSIFSRRIEWRGVRYLLHSDGRVEVIGGREAKTP